MKLAYLTERYGDRIIIRPSYYAGQAVFFAGRQPAYNQLILVDLPGLKQPTDTAIIDWLTAHAPATNETAAGETPASTRRQINELPETVWREMVLDDMLEVENYHYAGWRLSQHFDLQAFSDFAGKWLAEAQTRLNLALTASEPERVTTLDHIQPFLERVFQVVGQAPHRVQLERMELIKGLEAGQIALLRREAFDPLKWISLANSLQTYELARDLLIELVQRLIETGATQPQLEEVLTTISRSEGLKRFTMHTPGFWHKLRSVFRLEPTVVGETIDITDAVEEKVELNWSVIEARRVGRIIPGRSALVLKEGPGRITYIGAGRKLKFQVNRAGGRLEKLGNVLLVRTAATHNLQQALLRVELLDTLANLDPVQALAQVESLGLPPDHPIFAAAEAAPTDPRQARILADLLIEVAAGLDADVARRLVRAQSRQGR